MAKNKRFQSPEGDPADDLRGHLVELYARTLASEVPTDQLIGRFLRLRKEVVGSARGFLAATLFALLRKRVRTMLIFQWAGHPAPEPTAEFAGEIDIILPAMEAPIALFRWAAEDLGETPERAVEMAMRAVAIARERKLPEREEPIAWPAGIEEVLLSLSRRLHAPLSELPECIQRAAELSVLPDILNRWEYQFGEATAAALAAKCQEAAPLHLRVNVNLATKQQVIDALRAGEVEAKPCRFAPDGIHVLKKTQLKHVKELNPDWYELQDEGSQLVGVAVGVESGWKILDACAGGGGKSIQLAMNPRAKIFAHDLDADRLAPLEKRASEAKVPNITMLAPGTAGLHAPYDAVLIDAPCTSLGRLRRDPGLAWRGLLSQRLREVTAMQRECLEQYAPLVKPDGVLVYATCSFEPEETTEMIDDFLAQHPEFSADKLPTPFEADELRGLNPSRATLLPSITNTDGFFIARLRRLA
ncbi:hypothetical protein BH09SUM1_BH09SUM1_12260 [soil metagenome]